MAQIPSPDQVSSDPSLGEQPESGGKTSFFGKIKNKTKDKTKKLRTKIPGNKAEKPAGEPDTSSSSSSEDEAESPVNNHMSGITQPAYEKSLKEGNYEDSTPKSTEVSPSVPAENFPGSFSNVAKRDEQDDGGLSKDFEGLSTGEKIPTADEGVDKDDSKPVTEMVSDSLTSAKDTAAQKFSGDGPDQGITSPDSAAVTDKAGDPTNKVEDVTDKAADVGKSWSQWAAEKVGYAKDSAVASAPTTADGKPVTNKAYESAVATKDTVHEQAVKPAYDQAVQTKDNLTSKAEEYHSNIPSDPAQQSYVQKATGGIYAAKDSLFSSTQPGDHDKALSQKVTESVGNLPATLKSSFGFGGEKTVHSPTTTPVPSGGSSDQPQSPGFVSKFTSLFAAKKPHEDLSPTSEPTATESSTETSIPQEQ